jgi:hypothetical protein
MTKTLRKVYPPDGQSLTLFNYTVSKLPIRLGKMRITIINSIREDKAHVTAS